MSRRRSSSYGILSAKKRHDQNAKMTKQIGFLRKIWEPRHHIIHPRYPGCRQYRYTPWSTTLSLGSLLVLICRVKLDFAVRIADFRKPSPTTIIPAPVQPMRSLPFAEGKRADSARYSKTAKDIAKQYGFEISQESLDSSLGLKTQTRAYSETWKKARKPRNTNSIVAFRSTSGL